MFFFMNEVMKSHDAMRVYIRTFCKIEILHASLSITFLIVTNICFSILGFYSSEFSYRDSTSIVIVKTIFLQQ